MYQFDSVFLQLIDDHAIPFSSADAPVPGFGQLFDDIITPMESYSSDSGGPGIFDPRVWRNGTAILQSGIMAVSIFFFSLVVFIADFSDDHSLQQIFSVQSITA